MESPQTKKSSQTKQTHISVGDVFPESLFLSLSKFCSFFSSFIELPGPPTNMAISNIGPRSVTLQFKPGYDGKTSISRWQVEAQVSQI